MSQESLRIAQIFDSCYDRPGGVPNYIDTLTEHYTREGHEVTNIVGESVVEDPNLITLGKTFPFPMNGNIVDVPFPTSHKQVQRTLDLVKPDIIHIGATYFPTTGGRFINRAAPETGVIGTFHVLPYRKSSEVGIRIAGMLSRSKHRIDHLFTASPAVQDFAKASFGLESSLVPCPVDIERFRESKRLPEYDDGKINIMYLGRLHKRKGCTYLLDAVAELDESTRSNVRVVLGGAGELANKLKQQAAELGIEDVVEFPGRIEENDKANFLASADITALPATSGESFGIVVVEALAAGGVVIGGDNPGYRTILQKRTPETLINPQDSDAFAGLLKSMVQNPTYLAELRQRQQVDLEEYSIQTVGNHMLDVYSDVLDKRSR